QTRLSRDWSSDVCSSDLAALLGGAGLVVDQDRHALDLAQAPLQFVQFLAVVELHARREQFAPVPARDVVADHHNGVDALGAHLQLGRAAWSGAAAHTEYA